MHSNAFVAFDSIFVIAFVSALKLAGETDEIHEGAAAWLLHLFTNGSSTAALNALLCLKPNSLLNKPRAKEKMPRTYIEVVNYIFQTY